MFGKNRKSTLFKNALLTLRHKLKIAHTQTYWLSIILGLKLGLTKVIVMS